MKKIGFTLAEILITLGIIGVVAALTMPALVDNSGQAKIGPSLAKFVNSWESAAQELMHEQEIYSITSASGYTGAEGENRGAKICDAVEKYMVGVKLPANKTLRAYTSSGTLVGNYGDLYQLKDGMVYHTNGWCPPPLNDMKPPFKGCVGEIVVDINGISGNNKIGREVFLFLIDDSGVLIPFGSNIYKAQAPRYASKNIECSLLADFDNKSSKQEKEDAQESLWACTGAIADNNWKADYK